jgi:hypothetical protein
MRRLALLSLLFAFTACGDTIEPTAPGANSLAPSFNSTSYDCTAQTEIPTLECAALVAFYNSTDGDNWNTNTDWLVTLTPCSWRGVSCTSGHVTHLGFHHGVNNLTGVIPSELSNLTVLERLELNSNNLTGTIPSVLGSLANLKTLALHANQLSGGIPAALGNLDSLRTLSLYGNQLSGPIPAALGNLGNLTTLHVGGNNLSGPIPSALGQLTNLGGLLLGENQLSGPIPGALGNLGNLSTLGLSNNNLSGVIPWQLGNLSNLQTLDLAHNSLSGAVPAQLAPSNFDEFFGRYEINDNDLTGLVPLGVAEAEKLAAYYCDFANNNFYVPDTPAYRALDSDSDGDICGLSFSPPTDVTDNVIDQVDDLVSDGTLNQGEGNSLTKQLSAAQKKMDIGQYQAAINILNAFITHVGDFVSAGKLTSAQGQYFIDQANILIAQCTALLP